MTGQIERIAIFAEVATEGSFAAAARRLNISRSIATRYVSELETDLGVQLLTRTTRKVSLTVSGHLFLDRSRTILRDLERARELVRVEEGGLSGTLRLSAPLSLGLKILPDILAQFRVLYPDVHVKLDLTDRFVDVMTENYDMTLRVSGPPDDKTSIWRKFCEVPRILVASPRFLERTGAPDHPANLLPGRCLGYSYLAGGTQLTLTHAKSKESHVLATTHPFQTNNGDMIAEMAIRDEGYALLPIFIVIDALKDRTLVPILPDWQAPTIWFTVLYPPYERLPTKVDTLSDFIASNLKTSPIREIFSEDHS